MTCLPDGPGSRQADVAGDVWGAGMAEEIVGDPERRSWVVRQEAVNNWGIGGEWEGMNGIN